MRLGQGLWACKVHAFGNKEPFSIFITMPLATLLITLSVYLLPIDAVLYTMHSFKLEAFNLSPFETLDFTSSFGLGVLTRSRGISMPRVTFLRLFTTCRGTNRFFCHMTSSFTFVQTSSMSSPAFYFKVRVNNKGRSLLKYKDLQHVLDGNGNDEDRLDLDCSDGEKIIIHDHYTITYQCSMYTDSKTSNAKTHYRFPISFKQQEKLEVDLMYLLLGDEYVVSNNMHLFAKSIANVEYTGDDDDDDDIPSAMSTIEREYKEAVEWRQKMNLDNKTNMLDPPLVAGILLLIVFVSCCSGFFKSFARGN